MIIATFTVTREICEEALCLIHSQEEEEYCSSCAIALAAQKAGVIDAEVAGDGLFLHGVCYLHTKPSTGLMVQFDKANSAYRNKRDWAIILDGIGLPITLSLVDRGTYQEMVKESA